MVLPVPGPAITAIRGEIDWIAKSCSSFRTSASGLFALAAFFPTPSAAAPFRRFSFSIPSPTPSATTPFECFSFSISFPTLSATTPSECFSFSISSPTPSVTAPSRHFSFSIPFPTPSATTPSGFSLSASSSAPLLLSPFAVISPPARFIPPHPNRLICPSMASSSHGSNNWIMPYSPSNPGKRLTFPCRRRRIPSAI